MPETKNKLKLDKIIVAGIDIDLSKGAAIQVCRGDQILRHAFIKNIKGTMYERSRYITKKVLSYLNYEPDPKQRPMFVGVEIEAAQAKGRYATMKPRFLGWFLGKLYENRYRIIEIPPKSVKKFVVNGNADKEQIAEEVFNIWGKKFLNSKNGIHDDLTDAFAIAQMTLCYVGYKVLEEKYSYINERQIESIESLASFSKIYYIGMDRYEKQTLD